MNKYSILHPFQGNLHKGMLHCPQGMPWSLKVQLLVQEYPFKITSFQMRIGHRSLIKLPVTIWWLKLGIAEWHLRHR